MPFVGIDHIDMRVPALGVVETFYDAFAQRLGLSEKSYAHVEFGGASWKDATLESHNAVEYHTRRVPEPKTLIFGVIEEPSAQPSRTRVAFTVPEDALDQWEHFLREIGAREIERGDADYPAVFFTDPLGTRLEVCARRPSR